MELSADLLGQPQHPELVGAFKMLRFLRGHHTVPAACAAYRGMLAHREAHGVEALRSEALDAAGIPAPRAGFRPDYSPTRACYSPRARLAAAEAQLLRSSIKIGGLVWPYLSPRFGKLLNGPWGGVPPCVTAGFDIAGHAVTVTVFARYRLNEIIGAGLGELWLELVDACDVFWDLLFEVVPGRH